MAFFKKGHLRVDRVPLCVSSAQEALLGGRESKRSFLSRGQHSACACSAIRVDEAAEAAHVLAGGRRACARVFAGVHLTRKWPTVE